MRNRIDLVDARSGRIRFQVWRADPFRRGAGKRLADRRVAECRVAADACRCRKLRGPLSLLKYPPATSRDQTSVHISLKGPRRILVSSTIIHLAFHGHASKDVLIIPLTTSNLILASPVRRVPCRRPHRRSLTCRRFINKSNRLTFSLALRTPAICSENPKRFLLFVHFYILQRTTLRRNSARLSASCTLTGFLEDARARVLPDHP